ncbi:alpha/beta-hydrolase [Xylona heveae TC161]|uniref:Alpha/beta-hydrolase n=1 Tax=Xylona heveae (strain CBS 132557 / TC161) TaxID=1328760 RepID=A0A165IBP9_XYLHT|nr:alpha/beta-hydrolase [Xylona heveae TC161]KZF24675.1 alpha/beta-hydrolase [Xylona heveae TC161]
MLFKNCKTYFAFLTFLVWTVSVCARPTSAEWQPQLPLELGSHRGNRNVSIELFMELEELARIVDISYCVGSTGIQKPFACVSRCSEFDGFELVTTWNTGPLLSDSCGYIVLSHPPSEPRIIVAFRGTYSITNTIVDLSTVPQEYIPYPGGNATSLDSLASRDRLHSASSSQNDDFPNVSEDPPCNNCTVHSGFYSSWLHTKPHVLPHLKTLIAEHPAYKLTLVGHSLGGAVAAIGALEMQSRGWKPQVTTFGEPRVGNKALMQYIDQRFDLGGLEEPHGSQPSRSKSGTRSSFRRVTHVDDPVPLLPLREWGYRMHAGEVYISKKPLSPTPTDLQHCFGDEDPACIASAESSDTDTEFAAALGALLLSSDSAADEPLDAQADIDSKADAGTEMDTELKARGLIPSRFKLWELFFAHRDYFWRLGLCVPGGDPHDWYRKYPHLGDGDGD